eukprot:7482160-Ditylum_brightwellii.AAC.1
MSGNGKVVLQPIPLPSPLSCMSFLSCPEDGMAITSSGQDEHSKDWFVVWKKNSRCSKRGFWGATSLVVAALVDLFVDLEDVVVEEL